MTYKTRALGTWNLLIIILAVLVGIMCCLSTLYYFMNIGNVNFMFVLPLFFVWPIIKLVISMTNRYIIFDGFELTFHIENTRTNILQFPKYYVEKLKLTDIDFYGVFTDMYVKDVIKASRKKGSKEYYDTIVVKEGKIEMPVGALKLGNPLVFVSTKGDSYAYDDSMFTEAQLSQLFYQIEKASGNAASGYVDGKANVSTKKTIASLTLFFVVSMIIMVLPIFAPYIECTIKRLPYVFMQFNQLQAAYSFILLVANIALVVFIYYKNFSSNEQLERTNLIAYIAAIAMVCLYGIFIALVALTIIF